MSDIGQARHRLPSPFEAPPAQEAGAAPQGDGSWLSPAASRESLGVTVDYALELGRGRVRKIAGLADVFQNVGVLAAQQRQEPILEPAHAVHWQRIEIAVDARI